MTALRLAGVVLIVGVLGLRAQSHLPAQDLPDAFPSGARVEQFTLTPDLRRTYYTTTSDIWLYDREQKKNVRIAAGSAWDLNLSPARDALVYTKTGDMRHEQHVWVLPLDPQSGLASGTERRLSSQPGDVPSVSPDGKSIAFAQNDAAGVGQSVVVVPIGGGKERVVAAALPAAVANIRWTPDGKTLYVGVNPPEPCVPEWSCLPLAPGNQQPGGTIRRVAVSGGTATVVAHTGSPLPGLSPDGTTLAYTEPGRSRQLVIADAAGRRFDTFTLPPSHTVQGWLGGATLLTFSSGSIRRVRLTPLAGGPSPVLFEKAGFVWEPSWPVGVMNLSSLRAKTPQYTRVHPLKPRERVFAYARISPDGRRLAYASQITARPSDQRAFHVAVVDLPTQKILFSESGIDAYWSTDGTRIIYAGSQGVTVRNVDTGAVSVSREAATLGDYFSWALRDQKDLILTIASQYYYLQDDKPVLPAAKVSSCDPIGSGDRPLISKDGRRITTFVKGNIVVRGLDNCDDIIDTGIQGAKADFSWDGRYIAFHAVKREGTGYEIRIVDLQQRTMRTLPGLEAWALFPSWTQDGRLCFRYDGADFRGFMMASGVLDAPAVPLPRVSEALVEQRSWGDIFPDTPARSQGLRLVMIWAPWSAHSFEAFTNLEQTRRHFAARGLDVEVMAAADPGSPEREITEQLSAYRVRVPRIALSRAGLHRTEARNQMPALLLFREGVLIDRRLGAQSFESLRDWLETVAATKRAE